MTALSARRAERYRPVTGTITPAQDTRWFASRAWPREQDDSGCPCEERPDMCRRCQTAYDEAGSASLAVFLAACVVGALVFLAVLALGASAVCAINPPDDRPHYCTEEGR